MATRIGPRFLEALENEDWDKLPGGVFNRGFVRSIARYLGLDEEAFLAEYDLAHNAHSQLLEQKAHKPGERIPSTPFWVPMAFLLGVFVLLAGLIVGGIYGWRRYVRRHRAPSSSFSSVVPPPSSLVLLDLNAKRMPGLPAPYASGTILLRSRI